MSSNRVIIFDTTLRDGEQSPGASMNQEEKLRIAQQLERLRVDVIEAGFPIASPGDFAGVKAVADTIRECQVAGLCRARDADIDRAWEALKGGADPRIHTFIATSPIHMRHKLKMEPDQVIEAAVAAVKRAKSYTSNVEWSAEDAGRSEMEFLARIVEAVIAAGATTINIPDTVGYTLPHEFGPRMAQLIENVPNSDKAVFSVHCHNDLGLATANSLAAVAGGARQVECTINGLGERAGNASLEEVVMALRTRQDIMPYETRIETTEITRASRLVSQITGFMVQPNKAIVGANAFAHESGIHQDGVLKNAITYEIMTPESVGLSTNRMVLGKHSGRHAFKDRLQQLGYELDAEQLQNAFQAFKELADKKGEVLDEDLAVLVDEERRIEQERYVLERLHVATGTRDMPVAVVEVKNAGVMETGSAWGQGSVESVFKALKAIIPGVADASVLLYQVQAVTQGIDAQAVVTVRLKNGDAVVQGQGSDYDVIVASARAFVTALNKMAARQEKSGAGV
ncbi:2-isopropylmalate synthase [Magnetofaba australis]|uniref:2-isopropylmalate synthase n=1 Tax=Magnetofaba australis IT-1 TaxID=1434232 RepID=A0A1Y2K767_9PROT|nr:2-isopropylmalate synthase [Magnetofaba australis]OSM04301.1 putative 2-isopropylmalate synthase [Magnetofaba australis IT-1]